MDLKARKETFGAEDLTWLGSAHGTEATDTITLDGALTGATFTDGEVPSGIVLAKVTSSGKYAPYGGSSNELQSVGVVGATAGTFTLTFDGETTGTIAWNANAAAVLAALEALSNLNVGDVTVTGGPANTTAFAVTFTGGRAGTNQPQITVDGSGLTGGSVTNTTTTAGGSTVSDGREVAVGFLATTVRLNKPTLGDPTTSYFDVGAAIQLHGQIIEANLPVSSGPGALDAAAKADLVGRIYYQ